MSKAKKVLLIIGIIALILGCCGFLFFRYFTAPVGKSPDKKQQKKYTKITELFYEGTFHNEADIEGSEHKAAPKGEKIKPKEMLAAEKIEKLSRGTKGELKLSWLGHSSELVQMSDQNILIDPVLTKDGKSLQMNGTPRRFSDVPFDIENMPEIDVVCISHDHFDHLDYGTIIAIDSKVGEYIVPLGVDAILKGWGIGESRLHVLNWWESAEIGGIKYTLTPAQHYSGRSVLKRNSTLWGGFYLQDGSHSLYFTGDTGYYDVFGRIFETLGAPDIMLADSGEDSPSWSHMSPDEVVKAAEELHTSCLVPVHWGAYLYGSFPWYKPAADIASEAADSSVTVAFPLIGHIYTVDELSAQSEFWWESCK